MYLFYQENTFLHPREVYNILTQDEEFPIIGTNVCSFMKNIHKKIKCNPENEDYEYEEGEENERHEEDRVHKRFSYRFSIFMAPIKAMKYNMQKKTR